MEKATSNNLPRISVVIPMKNERQYIGKCIESVIDQDYLKDLVELIIVDGGSDDGSLQIVEELIKKHSNIKLMGGPGVNCPAAMNIGIQKATGNVIAKVDAHGYAASDFLKMSAKYLSENGNIKCVGGPIRPKTETLVEKSNVLARSSPFGVGKGVYSMGKSSKFVDTVQCGVYKKSAFDEIGLFDESLQFGEDEEINWRIRKKGYKIFAAPEIKFFYFPRNSFRSLFKQYYNYGMLRVKVIQKHPDFFRIKHIIPAVFILSLFTAMAPALFSSLMLGVFLGIVALYFIASLTVSAAISRKEGWKYFGLLPISFAALHFGYGTGFLRGIIGLFSSGARNHRDLDVNA